MRIVYISITGKIKTFIHKTQYPHTLAITTGNELVSEPFILLTGTIGMGEIHTHVNQFLKNNHPHLQAVIGSGNKNWGAMYCKAAIDIAAHYQVPLLFCFESAGNNHDVARFHEVMAHYELKKQENQPC